jgi:hypothetical protein
MKIDEYIERKQLNVRLAMVPPSLAHKFKLECDVEYFSNKEQSRIVGICKQHGFFAAWKSQGITSGKTGKDYPVLDAW